jgi:hypothetical protein
MQKRQKERPDTGINNRKWLCDVVIWTVMAVTVLVLLLPAAISGSTIYNRRKDMIEFDVVFVNCFTRSLCHYFFILEITF